MGQTISLPVDEVITITRKEYEQLLADQVFLRALEAWYGYDLIVGDDHDE